MPTPQWRKKPLALAISILLGANTHAATIIVTTNSGDSSDPIECTLRAAITAANSDSAVGGCSAGSGADTIELPTSDTITLTAVDNVIEGYNGTPIINTDVTITGNGSTITRDPIADPFRILFVTNDEGASLTLQETTISGGKTVLTAVYYNDYGGAGILNRGNLTLTDSTVTNNTAYYSGGGITNQWENATATLTNSTVSGNSAGNSGGGIFNVFFTKTTLNNSTVSGNTAAGYGGGIHNYYGSTSVLTDSTISDNFARNSGGGLSNERENATITLGNSNVTGNTAGYSGGGQWTGRGGGIFNRAYLTLTNSTASNNTAYRTGGGIAVSHDGRNDTTISNSIVSGNTGDYGGGIYIGDYSTISITDSTISGNTGGGIVNRMSNITMSNSTVSGNTGNGIFNGYRSSAILENSTVSGNSANDFGGGIFSGWRSAITLTNSTISGNTAGNAGGGLSNFPYTSVTLTNSTIFGNSAPYGNGIHFAASIASITNLTNTILSNDYQECAGLGSIIDGGNNWIKDDTCGTIPSGAPPINLGPLVDNGGPTLTHALLAGSMAIDAIASGDCTVATDQRGIARPQPAGGNCDIGAFEVVQDVINIEHIITFFLEELGSGGLVGNSPSSSNPGKGPKHDRPVKAREEAFYNQLLAVEAAIEQGDYEQACEQLESLLKRLHSGDGDPEPDDFITGDSADELAGMLNLLEEELGCAE